MLQGWLAGEGSVYHGVSWRISQKLPDSILLETDNLHCCRRLREWDLCIFWPANYRASRLLNLCYLRWSYFRWFHIYSYHFLHQNLLVPVLVHGLGLSPRWGVWKINSTIGTPVKLNKSWCCLVENWTKLWGETRNLGGWKVIFETFKRWMVFNV